MSLHIVSLDGFVGLVISEVEKVMLTYHAYVLVELLNSLESCVAFTLKGKNRCFTVELGFGWIRNNVLGLGLCSVFS